MLGLGARVAAAQNRHTGAFEPADLMLLCAMGLWSLNYTVVKYGVTQFDALEFPAIRYGLGAAVLLVVLARRERSIRVRRRDVPLILISAILGVTLTQICFVGALSLTTASNTALLSATAPIFAAAAAVAIGIERLDRSHWIGVLIGMSGVFLIVGDAFSPTNGTNPLGDALALGAAGFSAVSTIPLRSLLQRYTATRILTIEMIAGSGFLVPVALPGLLNQDFSHVSAGGWMSLAYAAVVSGAVTNLLYFSAVGQVGPSKAAVFLYLEAFFGALLAVILLGEQLNLFQAAGGLLVAVGVLITRRRPALSGTPT